MCLEAASSWVAGYVEAFGQVHRVVITSHNLGLYTQTGKQPWQTDTPLNRRVTCLLQ